MTDTSQTRLAFIAESAYGTTPSTPAFQVLRYTSENFNPALQFASSNEIRADRNVSDMALVGSEAAGEIGFELSYGTLDSLIESVMYSTWSTDVIENGVTQKAFTFEKTFETGATDQYHRYTGCVANSLSLNCRAREIVTGSVGFLAKQGASAQAIITGATYTAANTNPVMNAAADFANLSITGATSPQIMALTLNIANNLRQQPVIGQVASKGIGAGRFVVTGEIEAYFENEELFELYLDDTYSDLAFRLGGASALAYEFELPKLKFTSAEIIAGGNDEDVRARMQFQAIYDSSEGSTLKITRDPS